MTLTQAIERVVSDTRENTDPDMTILEVVEMVRALPSEELTRWLIEGIVDQSLFDAYASVHMATDEESERAAGILIASL